MKRGFSLVELSIVLVILGLLVGGVLSGQSLIHAAELRTVTRDLTNYKTALGAFRDKYFYLPGDLPNATNFWGKDNMVCSGTTGAVAVPGTCNGDGNGQINYAYTSAPAYGEDARSWQQLQLAGLIEGSYSGTDYPIHPGVNMPAARIASAGYALYFSNNGGDADPTKADRNRLVFGTPSSNWNMPGGPALKAEDAWNIDTKIDDGVPWNGSLYSYTGDGAPTQCSQASGVSSTYVLTDPNINCYMTYLAN